MLANMCVILLAHPYLTCGFHAVTCAWVARTLPLVVMPAINLHMSYLGILPLPPTWDPHVYPHMGCHRIIHTCYATP